MPALDARTAALLPDVSAIAQVPIGRKLTTSLRTKTGESCEALGANLAWLTYGQRHLFS